MYEKKMKCFSLSPEMNLMISLAAGKFVSAPAENISWKHFEELVHKNRIEPLVAAGIKKMPQEMVQQHSELQKLLRVKNSFTLFSMRQMQALAFIMSDFHANGIRALSVKGPLLAMTLYGSPELRYSRDLDILVSENDFLKACERLEINGFQEEITAMNKTPKRRRMLARHHEEIHRIYFNGDICIDLHWRISHRWEESFDDLWNRRSWKQLFGQPICCLGELDNLSYLICHAAGHVYLRLRWLFDLYILLNRSDLDYSALYKEMAEKGVQEMLFETLLLLYCCPGFDMPPIKNSLFSMRKEKGWVKTQYRKELDSDYENAVALTKAVWPLLLLDETEEQSLAVRKYRSMLPVRGKKQSHLDFLISFFQPGSVDMKRFDFPDSLYFMYYIVRPFYKLWRMTPFYH